jgi:hypothetical protein
MPDFFNLNINLRGDLQVIRRDALTKKILSVWEKKNVITYSGMEALVKLMAPNASFGTNVQRESQIRSMRFGTNNTQPQRTDTNLASEAALAGVPIRIELSDAQRIIGAAGTVEYVATLSAAMGNGLVYREAGLFTRGTEDAPATTSNSVMFSRQVFPDQPKTSSVELEFRWRTTITV